VNARRNDLPVIDTLVFEALQANAGAEFVMRLVEAFAEEGPQLVDRLRHAAAVGDIELFETTAHSLKSNGVAFGAARLAEMARQMERQGLGDEPLAVHARVDALAAEVAAAVVALRQAALW
jgi:histidine phosphotransfer protein HptB